MTQYINHAPVSSWEDISREVDLISSGPHELLPATREAYFLAASQGTAFLTFAIGIDGVSIEIARYAQLLENIYGFSGDARIHFIAGKFSPRADSILKPHWSRYRIKGINGWSKWDGGKWFSAMFFEDMPAGSQRSSMVATEIYRQAKKIAAKLRKYLVSNNISLLIPVNVASNPGNLALALALVFVTEELGTVVINSNHDYYWDGGKPKSERGPGEEAGERDHFFRNMNNHGFFTLFQRLYPYQGRRWLQANINKRQSQRVVEEFGLPQDRVFEIGTCVGDRLFGDFTNIDIMHARERMAHILSAGETKIHPRSLGEHRRLLDEWMMAQIPIIIGARDDLLVDFLAEDLTYLLQPTRVIARKRIEKGVELIAALLQGPLRITFGQEPDRQLLLHITGPTPMEHQADLETILDAYGMLIQHLPTSIAERVFLAFSGGHETHDSFEDKSFDDMNIVDIYRMATAVLFPSEIEGRGLPIIESGAIGIPIICSRYRPEEVFADVIGEDLPEELQIHYLLFPEDDFSEEFLEEAAVLLTDRDIWTPWREHNRLAISARYSVEVLGASFRRLLDLSFEILE